MQLSERGYRKIQSYEGYGKWLPDGSCTAYREKINGKLDIPTLGYGCTKNVEMGMVWTKEQADAALKAEIAGHEARVTRLVTVELNQNEFDALVSFDFNTGALGKSSVLKLLNAGDRGGAAKAFALYNRFGGMRCEALVARRADEAALFLEPIEPATESTMPQQPEKSPDPLHPAIPMTAAVGAGAALQTLPAPPAAVTDTLSQVTAWSDIATTLQALGPWMLAGVALTMGGLWIWRGK